VPRERDAFAREGSPMELRQPDIPPSETSSGPRHGVRTDATTTEALNSAGDVSGLGRHPHRSGPDSGAVSRHGFQVGDGGRATSCLPAFGVFRGGSRPRSRPSASPKVSRCQLPRPRPPGVLDQDRGHSARHLPHVEPVAGAAGSQSVGSGASSGRGQPHHRRGVGPRNLLGNLLCAAAGLLDAPSPSALNDVIADCSTMPGNPN